MAKQKPQEIARLKEFVPGKLYFEYQRVFAEIARNAGESEEARRKANLDAQIWLLSQCYEVAAGDKVRPLSINDIAKLNGFALNSWLANISKRNFEIETLDKKSLAESLHFNIVKGDSKLTVKLREPTLDEAYDIQQESQGDDSGNGLTLWVIKNLFSVNGAAITDEDLNEVYDYKTVTVLANKVNDFLASSLQSETLYCLPSTPDGD